MMNSSLFAVVEESGLSPEEFGKIIGVSGMSLRRWISKDSKAEVAKAYRPAVREAVYELLANGTLNPSSSSVQELIKNEYLFKSKAAIKNLGIEEALLNGDASSDKMLEGLCQIGVQGSKQNEVDANEVKIFSFQRLGADWKSRISLLWKITQSKEITRMDKFVAFGALFYLLTPIDFVPDHIPFFGLLDDMAVLGLAANYYAGKFQGIV
jgi:uncharacterized membrane protein YkvA (DUF1232 family)